MKITAALSIAFLLAGCNGGFTEVSPLRLIQAGDSLSDKFVRTCGYVVADQDSCGLKVCAADTPADAIASCTPISMIHLSSTACSLAPLPRNNWAMVDGYFLALEAGDTLTDKNRFVLRKALIQPVEGHCTEGGT